MSKGEGRVVLIVIVVSMAICFRLSGKAERSPSQEKYKYIINVGSSFVSLGYLTNDYVIFNGMVTFKTKAGMRKSVPMCSVMGIDEH